MQVVVCAQVHDVHVITKDSKQLSIQSTIITKINKGVSHCVCITGNASMLLLLSTALAP